MKREYGELMSLLLHRRETFDTDEKFRAFVTESVRALAGDLRDFGLEVSVKAEAPVAKRPGRDWNFIKIGCE